MGGYKFRLIRSGIDAVLIPLGNGVNKPVSANTVPTAKTGLLNPDSPIVMTAYSNKVYLGFNHNLASFYSARLLDSKGKLLGSAKSYGSDEPVQITLQRGTKNYYLEFANENKYYYILLNRGSDNVRPAEDKAITRRVAELKASNQQKLQKAQEYEQLIQAYMKRHNITACHALTERDMMAINKEYDRAHGVEEDEVVSGMQAVIDNYMKQHGKKSISELTQKDMEEIGKLMMDENGRRRSNETTITAPHSTARGGLLYIMTVPDGAQFSTKKCDAAPPSVNILHIA